MKLSVPLPLFAGMASLFFHVAAFGIDSNEISVEVSIDENAPSVTFDWDSQRDDIDVLISRREIGRTGTDTWNLLATVEHPTTTYTDPTLSTGVAYEYKVYRSPIRDDIDAAARYIAVGLEAPLVEQRGKMLLLVEEEMGLALAPELAQLELDLAADGWEVIRQDFAREGDLHPDSVRAWIQAKYAEDPANTTGLYLFGRLPFMRTAGTAPDGHGRYNHATDPYFADVNDPWRDNGDPADTIVNEVYIPEGVELMFGRVDLAGMSAWTKSEEELLRDYLNKASRFKRAGLDFTRRGTPAGSNWVIGEGHQQYSMFGPANITEVGISGTGLRDDNGDLIPGTFQWVVDFGSWRGADYADNEHRSLFNVNFGSHKQKWSRGNNAMRALLAQPEWGLTCVWGGRPYWFFHTGNMGYPAGDWAKRTVNNRTGEYTPEGAYPWMRGALWNNLMGDPSLRMHPVAPPRSPSASRAAGEVTLNWTAATDGGVLGYNVYRSTSRVGAYSKLNGSSLVSASTFVDTSPPANGDLWYQVRAVKLEEVYTGSYYNQSLGVFAHLADGDSTSNAAPVMTGPATLTTVRDMPILFEPEATDADGDPMEYLVHDHPENGMLRGGPSKFIYQPGSGFSGSDAVALMATDGAATSAPFTIPITVSGSSLLAWSFDDTSDTQDLSSDSNSPDVLPATITRGPGLRVQTWLSHEDAAAARDINPNTLDADDYFSFTLEPTSGKVASLSDVFLSVYSRDENEPFFVRLRFSFDGFTTWRGIPVTGLDSHLRGRGTGTSDGISLFADLSEIAELQSVEGAVEFRLYFWGNDRAGIGKSGLGVPDLVITGSTADAPSPGNLEIVTDSIGPAEVNETTAFPLIAGGGVAPYSWTNTGALPAGLSLSSDGVISGAPSATFSGDVTFEVTDDNAATAQRVIPITVQAAPSAPPADPGALTLEGANDYLVPPSTPPVLANGSQFALQRKGESNNQSFTLKNVGGEALTGLSLVLAGDSPFSLSSPLEVTSLAPGATASFTVNFSDTVIGDYTATLTVDATEFDAPLVYHLAGSIISDDVTFVQSSYWAPEDTHSQTVTVEVERIGGGDGAASVDVEFSAPSSDATLGEDFSFTTQTLTWADGETGAKPVNINVFSDTETEDDEDFYLILTNLVNVYPGEEQYTRVVISNDDEEERQYEDFFPGDPFDLDGLTLQFIPDGEGDYDVYKLPAAALPTDPAGATVISSTASPMSNRSFVEVALPGGFTVPFFGTEYSRFFIGSSGYITFESGDIDHSGSSFNFYEQSNPLPRIAPFWIDFDPGESGTISWQAITTEGQERLVVTFEDMKEPDLDDDGVANYFTGQIELWQNGLLTITIVDTIIPDVDGDEVADDYYYFFTGISSGEHLADTTGLNFTDFPPPGTLVPDQTAPLGEVGTAYTTSLLASGGEEPYVWQAIAGLLPDGLSLDTATGELSGLPSAAGLYSFTLRVTDNLSDSDTGEVTVGIISSISDIDGNGLLDSWEIEHFEGIGQDPADDPDEDGAPNEDEQDNSGDPHVADTDGDGVEDGPEISLGRMVNAYDLEPLDWLDTFDDRGPGSLLGTPAKWSFFGSGTIELVNGVGQEATRGLELTTAAEETAHIAQFLDVGYEMCVWTDFYAKLAVFGVDADPPPPRTTPPLPYT